MGRKVDLDDLLDATAVADLIGLGNRNSVSLYRRRYADFPAPVLEPCESRCPLWLRRDVEKWAKRTGRLK